MCWFSWQIGIQAGSVQLVFSSTHLFLETGRQFKHRFCHDEQLTAYICNWRVWKIVFLLSTGANVSYVDGSVFQPSI